MLASFVDQAGLHAIMSDKQHFTIARDGELSRQRLDGANTDLGPDSCDGVNPKDRSRATCLASGQDGSVTLTLPLCPEPIGPIQRLTVRREGSRLPSGPQVFPSERQQCPPEMDRFPAALTVGGGQTTAQETEWIRASYEDGWVVVYYVPGDSSGRRPGSVRIERHERWMW
jgi:hypothetical protein